MTSSSTGCIPPAWPAPAPIKTIAWSSTVGTATRSWGCNFRLTDVRGKAVNEIIA